MLLLMDGCRPGRVGVPKLLRIGYAVEEPYAFVRGSLVTGEAPEIAKLAAAQLGVSQLRWVQLSFDGLIEALLQKRVDVIAAGMFITPERSRRVAFSRPTLAVKPGLLVLKENPAGLRPGIDLRQVRELCVATVAGSQEQAWLSEHGSSFIRLLNVPDAITGRAAVLSGAADTLALSVITLQSMVRSRDGWQLQMMELEGPGAPPRGEAAFVFRIEDVELRESWDEFLKGYLGSRSHRMLLRDLGIPESCIQTTESTAP